MPVVNEAGELIGIVSEADLIGNRFPATEQAAEAAAAAGPATTVGEVMSTPVIGVSHDTDVSVVAREMLTGNRRGLPIVDGTVLVGVITRRDIVRALARTDEEIVTDIRAKLGVIGGLSRWSVQVGNGEVVLTDRYREEHPTGRLPRHWSSRCPASSRCPSCRRRATTPDPGRWSGTCTPPGSREPASRSSGRPVSSRRVVEGRR